MNNIRQQGGAMFAAMDGTTGNINILQRDMNKALAAWSEQRDASGLAQVVGTLRVMGNLTDGEYEQIMEALDGEK